MLLRRQEQKLISFHKFNHRGHFIALLDSTIFAQLFANLTVSPLDVFFWQIIVRWKVFSQSVTKRFILLRNFDNLDGIEANLCCESS